MTDNPSNAGAATSTGYQPAPWCGISRNALLILLVVFIAGASLRLFGLPHYKRGGYDEVLYSTYVTTLDAYGLLNYPAMVRVYIEDQKTSPTTKLPPTRFLYIFMAYGWDRLFHDSELESLHAISCLFSILVLPLAAVFAYRLGGERMAVGTLVLVTVSPMQIYVSRHALIDGFFAFWALLSLWLLWENLQKPRSAAWLACYTASLALMVITKENAFFVFIAIAGILAVNRWTKFGIVNLPLTLCTLGGGALGVAILSILSGGLDTCIETYLVLMKNASHFPYAIKTGDGPWYRYLYDMMLMGPIVLMLAIGAAFRVTREKKDHLFLLAFIAFSYLVMCNVKYGMNLRYTSMWDMPMRYLAFWQLCAICDSFKTRRTLALILCMAVLCGWELRQYYIVFVENNLYELITAALTHALKIVK